MVPRYRHVGFVAMCVVLAHAAAPAQQRAGNDTSALLSGGTSPNGRYEVRIVKTDTRDPSNYLYALVDVVNRRTVKTLSEGGGYFDYDFQTKGAVVRWHASSAFFALTDRGTKHTQELYVYEVKGSNVVLLALPDYRQNALGRVDAVETDLTSVTEPLAWDGDLLKCRLTFDVMSQTRGREAHAVDFALRLWHGNNSETRVSLGSMGKPRGGAQG